MLLELFLLVFECGWYTMSKHFSIESFGSSDIGLIRKNNEDSFRLLTQEQFYVLADGMGGHRAGEVASSRAVEYMCSGIQDVIKKYKNPTPIEDLTSQIGSLIENTNLWIHHLGSSNPDFSGMGTTLCSLLFHKNFIIYSHVGDSRIYRLRKGILEQLTKDHLVFYPRLIRQEMIQTGIDDRKESATGVYSKQRKVLAQAIGTSLAVIPETSNALAEVEDIYLLCSDGLSDLVPNEEICSLMTSSNDLQVITSSLIERAKEYGGHDNITLVLAKVVK